MPNWTRRASRCSTACRRRRYSAKAGLAWNGRAACSSASWGCSATRPPARAPRRTGARSGQAAQTAAAKRNTPAAGRAAAGSRWVVCPPGQVQVPASRSSDRRPSWGSAPGWSASAPWRPAPGRRRRTPGGSRRRRRRSRPRSPRPHRRWPASLCSTRSQRLLGIRRVPGSTATAVISWLVGVHRHGRLVAVEPLARALPPVPHLRIVHRHAAGPAPRPPSRAGPSSRRSTSWASTRLSSPAASTSAVSAALAGRQLAPRLRAPAPAAGRRRPRARPGTAVALRRRPSRSSAAPFRLAAADVPPVPLPRRPGRQRLPRASRGEHPQPA